MILLQTMKIFATYLTLDLINPPKWFEDFRKRNNAWFDLHITLTQPRYIEEDQIEQLKETISSFVSKNIFSEMDKKLFFDKASLEKTADEEFIFMWFLKKNDRINILQKGLVEIMRPYKNYVDVTTVEYESQFRPHITVAEALNSINKLKAEELIASEPSIEGVIKDLALPIVKDTSREERENKENIFLFKI